MWFVNNKKTVSFRGATLMLLIKQNSTSKRFERSATFTGVNIGHIKPSWFAIS